MLVPWFMTCNRCETGEGMYFGFTAICKDNKHPGSIGEHTHVCQFCKYNIFLDGFKELYLSG
jgi:hypothetical protein